MLDTASTIAFLASTDLAEAQAFYGGTLGLKLLADERPHALVFDAAGTMLRISLASDLRPAPFTVLGWQVEDIAESVGALGSTGVDFERFPYFDQDDLGIWTAPDATRVAWFRDPAGNLLSLTEFQASPSA